MRDQKPYNGQGAIAKKVRSISQHETPPRTSAEPGGAGAAIQNPLVYLDDTDCHGLPHVPDGKLGDGLDTHGLGGDQLHDSGVPGLDELGASSVDLPVRLSTFSKISANLQDMCAVWQSSTGE